MTCIIGLEEDGKAYVAADSAVRSGWNIKRATMPKIFRKGKFIIATSGTTRFTQIVQYLVDFPEIELRDEEYIVTKFSEALRVRCKELGYSEVSNNKESTEDVLIVGFNNRVFGINTNYSVYNPDDGLIAYGSGGDFALGAMKALSTLPPNERLITSLGIAEYFNAGVNKPFTILEVR